MPEGELIGGRERGRVGRRLGARRGNRRAAEPGDRDAHHERDADDRDHQHGHGAPLVVPPHRSLRITARAVNSGSGNEGTDERQVGVRPVAHDDRDRFTDLAARTMSTVAPASTSRAAASTRPPPASTAASRTAARARPAR